MKSWEIEEMRYNQGKADGRKEGKEEGILQILVSLVRENKMEKAEAAKRMGMSVEQFERKLAESREELL